MEFLGLNLPFYIIIAIIYSYLLWSKYIKEGALRPQKSDDLLKIMAISIIVFLTILGLLFGVYLTINSLNLNLDFPKQFDTSTFLFILIMGGFIFSLIIETTDKECNLIGLKRKLLQFLFTYLCALVFLFGFLIIVVLSHLRFMPLIISFLLIMWMVALIIALLCLSIVKNVFNVNFYKRIIKKDLIMLIIIILFLIFLGILIGYLSLPDLEYNEKSYLSYQIYSPNYLYGSAYVKFRAPIIINNFGFIGSIADQIPIDYGSYDIETTSEARGNFKLLVNTSKEPALQEIITSYDQVKALDLKTGENFGFTDFELYEKSQKLSLKFDELKIKNQGINSLILEGYIKKNLSELNYSYIDNTWYREVCYGTGCSIIFNITNNLDLPVHQHEQLLFNFNNKNIINKSNCEFIGVTSNYPSEGYIYMHVPRCGKNECRLNIYDKNLKKGVFNTYLYIDKNVVRLIYVEFKKPLSINFKVNIDCT